MDEDNCLKILHTWIIEQKRVAQNTYKGDSTNDLKEYTETLETLERKLRKAIYLEDFKGLETLGWPQELMECIKDMTVRPVLLDLIYESLIIHKFNRSPMHENELKEENAGLN